MLPRYIALCGHPKAGKSLVQEFLDEDYGYLPVDDGFAMRDFAMRHLGLTHDQVYTQAGKAEFVELGGKTWQVREILGQLGNRYEEMFGPDAMPMMAHQSIERRIREGEESADRFSFGSVRRQQGGYYKRLGGLIIGIHNPQALPSPYEFDKFDESLVDVWIENDALARGLSLDAARDDLQHKVWLAIGHLRTLRAA